MLHITVTLTDDPEIAIWLSKGEEWSEIIGWILQFEKKPQKQMQHRKASSFLSCKNKAKIHLFRKFHIWQDYCINDKLTSFVPLYLFQPHIYLLIHAKFFQVLHTGGCWLFSEKQFLKQPISSFRLSDLAREWNTACCSPGHEPWRNKITTWCDCCLPHGTPASLSSSLTSLWMHKVYSWHKLQGGQRD